MEDVVMIFVINFEFQKSFYQLSVCHFQNCDLSFTAQTTEGKEICKLFVQRGLGLVSEDISASRITRRVPLVVCITRLVAQKGLHLITHAIKHVEELVSLLPFYYAHISCPLVMSGGINICNTTASLQNNIKFYLFIAWLLSLQHSNQKIRIIFPKWLESLMECLKLLISYAFPQL